MSNQEFMTGMIMGRAQADRTVDDWSAYANRLKHDIRYLRQVVAQEKHNAAAGWTAVWGMLDSLQALPQDTRCAVFSAISDNLHASLQKAYLAQGLSSAEAVKNAGFMISKLRESWAGTAAIVDRKANEGGSPGRARPKF